MAKLLGSQQYPHTMLRKLQLRGQPRSQATWERGCSDVAPQSHCLTIALFIVGCRTSTSGEEGIRWATGGKVSNAPVQWLPWHPILELSGGDQPMHPLATFTHTHTLPLLQCQLGQGDSTGWTEAGDEQGNTATVPGTVQRKGKSSPPLSAVFLWFLGH